jgi:HSP20 family protein
VWVHIDLPGVSADSLDISVERNVLTVTAERDWQREEGDKVYLAERSRGAYSRQVHLGDGLDADSIEADFHDGVLTLRIPIAEKAQPRRIAINTEQPAIDVESTTA